MWLKLHSVMRSGRCRTGGTGCGMRITTLAEEQIKCPAYSLDMYTHGRKQPLFVTPFFCAHVSLWAGHDFECRSSNGSAGRSRAGSSAGCSGRGLFGETRMRDLVNFKRLNGALLSSLNGRATLAARASAAFGVWRAAARGRGACTSRAALIEHYFRMKIVRGSFSY